MATDRTDEAARRAEAQCAALRHAGLRDGMALIELGCGGGRLAQALGRRLRLTYCGIDATPGPLEAARRIAPPQYRFILGETPAIPAPDQSADMICGFDWLTRQPHHASYLGLEDAARVLRPGGHLVLAFLEFAEPSHWPAFAAAVAEQRRSTRPAPAQFIERAEIAVWAPHLGLELAKVLGAQEAPWGAPGPLGRSLALLRRPAG